MSDEPRSKLGPLPPEAFDSDPTLRAPGVVEHSYSEEFNAEMEALMTELKRDATVDYEAVRRYVTCKP